MINVHRAGDPSPEGLGVCRLRYRLQYALVSRSSIRIVSTSRTASVCSHRRRLTPSDAPHAFERVSSSFSRPKTVPNGTGRSALAHRCCRADALRTDSSFRRHVTVSTPDLTLSSRQDRAASPKAPVPLTTRYHFRQRGYAGFGEVSRLFIVQKYSANATRQRIGCCRCVGSYDPGASQLCNAGSCCFGS